MTKKNEVKGIRKEILDRRVEEILPEKKSLERAMQEKNMRIYLGVDPTSPDLHLGHAVLLRKLKEFQELGHKVILLFGTFTAQIGDPSGRDKQREPLSEKQILQNMKTYQRQAEKILDFSRVETRKNGEWLAKMKFQDILSLASHITVSQLLERDMFQKRMREGNEVWVHELLYPLMQGYDSVALDVDLEIGGTDQTFNMLMGRRLQKVLKSREKFVLAVPLLLGLDGRKMSKSYGNTVNLLDSPNEMYGKLMSVRDELIWHYVELATDMPEAEVVKLKEESEKGRLSVRDAKAMMAKEVVRLYYGEKKAKLAEEEFIRVFSKKEVPSDMPVVRIGGEEIEVLVLLEKAGLVESKSQGRRLLEQGGVKIDGERQTDEKKRIHPREGMVVQIGKRNFAKIQIK